ncbi:ABC transporter ATP-binding protein [Streptomyces sp. NPDC055078]
MSTRPEGPSGLRTDAVNLVGIRKAFGQVVANDGVDLSVADGTIHAVLGENGAGKSTLMAILAGLVKPDAGEIRIHGTRMAFASPSEATRAGIGMVHQSFQLFANLSVTDNVVFGAEPGRLGAYDRKAAEKAVAELSGRYGLDVDPRASIADLPVGVRQRVEILKTLYRRSRIIILDEPTAVLTPQERDSLFVVLRELRDAGHTIILITHKLLEVMALCDNVTVLRDGRTAATSATADTSPAQIGREMTGRNIETVRNTGTSSPGRPVLTVSGLRAAVPGSGDGPAPAVSLEVGAGEIVGIAGVAGNGQDTLVETLVGLRPSTGGTIVLNGTDVTGRDVATRRACGMSYVPEDRDAVGSARQASITDNLVMGSQRAPEFATRGWLRRGRIHEHAVRLCGEFRIKTLGPSARAGGLSGGNLQKVILAREISRSNPLLIVEQPTRGVDIGAIEAIHRQLLDYRDQGHGVLLVSAELSEILALSDRVLVMFEGGIAGEVDGGADERRIGELMGGYGVRREGVVS